MNSQARKPGNWIRYLQLILVGVSLMILGLLLAWFSSHFANVDSWPSFLFLVFLAGGVIYGCWLLVKADHALRLPNWLGWLIIGAALLRLLVGVLWFAGLPNWGYGSPVEQSGYIMADNRNACLKNGQSGKACQERPC